jgi:hypothetical protein
MFLGHDDALTTVSTNENGGDAVGLGQASSNVVTLNGDLEGLYQLGQVPAIFQHLYK